jgi:thermolysin
MVAASTLDDATRWSTRIDTLVAEGRLCLVRASRDAEFPGRRHLRYDQRLVGLPVYGVQLVRQVDSAGRTLTVFGHLIDATAGDPGPQLSPAQAAHLVEADLGRGAQTLGEPELLWLPLDSGLALAYAVRARSDFRLPRYFVDASTGAVLLTRDELRTEAAVGIGTGVWGDRKKVSADSSGNEFHADDRLRPPAIVTYDMRFDIRAAVDFLLGGALSPAFLGADSDNDWADGTLVDAHAYAGWTYDYYFKRFGRRGIDDANLTIRGLVHIVPAGPDGLVNAFWDGLTSTMFYGDGDQDYGSFSGALDVVAHELTHGVTQYTWGGGASTESGALGEAFSDIMGTSAEFFLQPLGDTREHADYWLGEDLSYTFEPRTFAARSMENPSLFCHAGIGCDPDHYSHLYRGPLDAGGVHVNAGIATHAFYLLIEGGTNRTSGIAVAGLGAAKREKAERIFYRGFTTFLTPGASFSDARRATTQAAVELFGALSPEAVQTTLAWSAVGVE